MTQLNDPTRIGFDGEPITGRLPPRLFVYGELTRVQRGAVEHAYKLFCDAVRVTPGKSLIQNRTLVDGTRVRMISANGQDQVLVWPTGGSRAAELPHGFAVRVNWFRPVIFKRRLPAAGSPMWAVDSVDVPQAKTEIESDSSVFRISASGSALAHPLALNKTPRLLWDYLRRTRSLGVSANVAVPVCIEAEVDGVPTYNTGLVHIAVGPTIVSEAGTLYTMSTTSPILVEPEPPVYAPASTTATGSQLVMQHYRAAVIAPTSGVFQVKTANERLRRISPNLYEAIERREQSFVGPIGASATGGGVLDSLLGESLDGGIFLNFGAIGPTGVGGAGIYGSYITEFSYTIPHNLTPHATPASTAYREQGPLPGATDAVIHNTLACPSVSTVVYPALEVNYGISGTVYWRAGFASIGTPNPVTIPDFSGTAWYGDYFFRKNRIDAELHRDTAPSVLYRLEWTDVSLFSGTSAGDCSGATYSDERKKARSQSQWDGNFLTRDYIFPGAAPPINESFPAAAAAATVKPAIVALLADFPPTLGGDIPSTVTVLRNDRPINTGEYTYSSRYVIDYDHKGQFYAAIHVQVECAGAEWRENAGVYEGFMELYSSPSYTITIRLETRWKETTGSTTLVTISGTRPPFEFVEVQKQNPYYFLSPGFVDRQTMLVRMPPSFGVPIEGFSQLKNLMGHQGSTPALACEDVRPETGSETLAKSRSVSGIEFSKIEGGKITPHKKFVTGQLYAKTFKLSDFPDALWLLKSTKCDATENNGPTGAPYFYFAGLANTIANTVFHVEVRDGVHEMWSSEIAPGLAPTPTSRNIEIRRV